MFNSLGVGMGLSIVCIATIVKLIFLPLQLLNAKHSYQVRRLGPDMNEFVNRIKKLNLSGNHLLAKKESERFAIFKKDNGLSGLGNMLKFSLNILQGFTLLVWACLMQKYTYKLEDYPQMISGGFFWFKDLTLSDPYFILPLLNSINIFLTILLNNQMTPNQVMVKGRRLMLLAPLLSFPIFTSLQSGMILYFVTMTSINTLVLFIIKSKHFQKYNNIDNIPRNIALFKVVR